MRGNMEHRRRIRATLVLVAAGLAAAALLPSSGLAARLRVHAVANGVVIRLVGAKPNAVRYTLGHHTVGRARRAPFNLVLYGYALASRGTTPDARVKLVARNGRNGRKLAVTALVRAGKPAKPSRKPAPTVSFTSVPPATTTSTSATLAFAAKNATSTGCSLDGAAFVSCASPVLFTSLALGKHALTVLAANSAGVATAVASWGILAPPPVAPPPPPPPPGSGIVTAAPVTPPSPYNPPATALTVYGSAQLKQALAGPTGDIV